VALALGAEPEDVLEAMQASSAYRATSLDMPRAGGSDEPGTTLGDTIGRTEEGFDRAEQRALLSELMCSLTLRERNVIRLRFELDLTQAQIGERIGVSQMQVSRILRQSVARMRHGGLTSRRTRYPGPGGPVCDGRPATRSPGRDRDARSPCRRQE
jgi:RNA polymerase sigma-B factor